MTANENLDLKLSDEEIAYAVTRIIDDGSIPLPSAEEMARGVADAATAKAAWEIKRWLENGWTHMGSQGTYISMMDQLVSALNAAGVQRPTED